MRTAFGPPELYREANKEDPKEVLKGIVVAGLVGILRQLDDLAARVCGNPHGIIRKYGLMCCRQCFRSDAKEIGFIKTSQQRRKCNDTSMPLFQS